MSVAGRDLWPRLFLAVLAVGCGSSSPASSERPIESNTEPLVGAPLRGEPLHNENVEGCFVGPGAPDPHACEVDDDCTVGGLLLADTCCMSGVSHPHARAYHAWQTALFASRCGGGCMQPPSPPQPCELAVRCEANRCVNACMDVPSVGDGALDAMDRGELETLCEGGSTAACDRLGH